MSFGILAPGVAEDHFAIGGLRRLNDRERIDFSISYVPENTVSGPGMYGGTVELEMRQISTSVG